MGLRSELGCRSAAHIPQISATDPHSLYSGSMEGIIERHSEPALYKVGALVRIAGSCVGLVTNVYSNPTSGRWSYTVTFEDGTSTEAQEQALTKVGGMFLRNWILYCR